jgi:hypothetical protein
MSVLTAELAAGTFVFGLFSWAASVLLSGVTLLLTTLAGLLLSTAGAGLVVGGLFVTAIALNLSGVDDVYETLGSSLLEDLAPTGDRVDDEPSEPADALPEVDDDAVTDSAGRFSKSAFQAATGLTPPEFIHLFVRCRGGRIQQSTLYRCLPWSKSTAVRYLQQLEQTGQIVRIKVNGQNVVCTPEQAPALDD